MTEQERINSIIRKGGSHIKNFKKENITYGMCLAAVERDGYALYWIPEEFKTEEIYQKACKSNGAVLCSVPAEYVNKAICEDSVASNGLSLEYVPEKFKTDNVTLAAFQLGVSTILCKYGF